MELTASLLLVFQSEAADIVVTDGLWVQASPYVGAKWKCCLYSGSHERITFNRIVYFVTPQNPITEIPEVGAQPLRWDAEDAEIRFPLCRDLGATKGIL